MREKNEFELAGKEKKGRGAERKRKRNGGEEEHRREEGKRNGGVEWLPTTGLFTVGTAAEGPDFNRCRGQQHLGACG